MDDADAAALEHERRVLDRLEERARVLVGDRGTVERLSWSDVIWVVDITPANLNARRIRIVAEQRLLVSVGDRGGQFELSYSADDEAFAAQVIESVIAGRVYETLGVWGTTTHVEFEDGQRTSETAIAVWKRPGRSKRRPYEPY
ncbi:hypothetical protein GCM10009846_22400 [Agrococcus versicolor]|uniref:Uncharacterized protein n=1 Tax=Agrococcus versicolor TaxID=501482 RepID=A0ABN3AUZ7_9MICO